jgi:tRNA(Ile)-lysidine synthetase-like protein
LDPVYKIYEGEVQDTVSHLYHRIKDFVINNGLTNKNIGVSLSGGVDSMSLLFILKYLEVKKIISKVFALHLEYVNRKESSMETEMLGMYCSAVEIPFYTRVIDYMSRESVDRSFYEDETKKVRFSTYRYLSEKLSIGGWCLGHISNDVSENVVMNLCSGRDILDLKVMEKVSVLDGVCLLRPFLETNKDEIYEFAHTYSIPYFKDTTPDWSARGVLRRKVIPELKTQWPTIMDTLLRVGEQANEWKEVVEKFVMEPIKKEILLKKNMVDIFNDLHKNKVRKFDVEF